SLYVLGSHSRICESRLQVTIKSASEAEPTDKYSVDPASNSPTCLPVVTSNTPQCPTLPTTSRRESRRNASGPFVPICHAADCTGSPVLASQTCTQPSR